MRDDELTAMELYVSATDSYLQIAWTETRLTLRIDDEAGISLSDEEARAVRDSIDRWLARPTSPSR